MSLVGAHWALLNAVRHVNGPKLEHLSACHACVAGGSVTCTGHSKTRGPTAGLPTMLQSAIVAYKDDEYDPYSTVR